MNKIPIDLQIIIDAINQDDSLITQDKGLSIAAAVVGYHARKIIDGFTKINISKVGVKNEKA